MERQQATATETDRLLPSVSLSSNLTSYGQDDVSQYLRRRRSLVAGASILTLAFLVFAITVMVLSPGNSFRHGHHGIALKETTDSDDVASRSNSDAAYVTGALPAHVPQVREATCTSQVILMRHCDKKVKMHAHRKKKKLIKDMRDEEGDRHCNAKGEQRAEYVATLFADPALATRNASEAPPLPSVGQGSSAATSEEPQFPPPVKLYALSSERPKNVRKKKNRRKHKQKIKMKHSENFREIDTLTPLANKFRLDVDDRFGIDKEVDLAAEYFLNLNKHLEDYLDAMMRASNSTYGPANSTIAGGASTPCDGGVTVVNWKHSRIPFLARAFGCGTKQGCPWKYKGGDFDTMWLLTFEYSFLVVVVNEFDGNTSVPAWESSSRRKKRKVNYKAPPAENGNWKVTGQLVREGFEG